MQGIRQFHDIDFSRTHNCPMTVPPVEWFDAPGGEPVVLCEYTNAWLLSASNWIKRIRSALSAIDVEIDHVGSTAVPGLLAKPVIDLQVQVPDLSDESAYVPPLETLGLVRRARGNDFRFLRPPTGQQRDVHVHVCEKGSRWARDHLTFRDALRVDSARATEYGNLKSGLAQTNGHDRAAYNAGKASFIRKVIDSQPESH